MRFGCCGSMISPSGDPIGVESVEAMAEAGFDYCELSLRDMAVLSDAAFAALARRVDRSGIRCEACNNFFLPEIRLTGSDIRIDRAVDYATAAMDRAARLGAKAIVFGSSGARNVPEGFPTETAWRQLVELLGRLGPLAAQRGITITIEHLTRGESNIVNRVSEGLQLTREVDHPAVQLLIDFYHLKLENEDPRMILEAGPLVRHVHLAKVDGRRFPTEWEADYGPLFKALDGIGYSERCSIEAYTQDFPADARRAIRSMRDRTAMPMAPHA